MTPDTPPATVCAHCPAELEGPSTRTCDEGCREPICERCYSDRSAPECPEAVERDEPEPTETELAEGLRLIAKNLDLMEARVHAGGFEIDCQDGIRTLRAAATALDDARRDEAEQCARIADGYAASCNRPRDVLMGEKPAAVARLATACYVTAAEAIAAAIRKRSG